MVPKNLVLPLVFVSVTASAGFAQPARYTLSPGDTTAYHELTTGVVAMRMPQGVVEVKTIHDAVIRIEVVADGTSRAWYDSLHLLQEGPGPQRQQPGTVGLLRRPFKFHFDPAGRVTLISIPDIPPEIASMTDLSRQFDDFFITLPDEELAVGTVWTDTVTREGSAQPTDTYFAKYIRTYRVDRDTLIVGEVAYVIAVEQAVTLEASSPMPQPGFEAFTKLTGTDEGFAIFNVHSGSLLHRTRVGLLEGELRVTGGAQPMVIPQRYRYESTIRRLE